MAKSESPDEKKRSSALTSKELSAAIRTVQKIRGADQTTLDVFADEMHPYLQQIYRRSIASLDATELRMMLERDRVNR